jgi:hypothetical protein
MASVVVARRKRSNTHIGGEGTVLRLVEVGEGRAGVHHRRELHRRRLAPHVDRREAHVVSRAAKLTINQPLQCNSSLLRTVLT